MWTNTLWYIEARVKLEKSFFHIEGKSWVINGIIILIELIEVFIVFLHVIFGLYEHLNGLILVLLEIDSIEFFTRPFDVLVHMRDINEGYDIIKHIGEILLNIGNIDVLLLFLESSDFMFSYVKILAF